MEERHKRSAAILGCEAINKLKKAKVAVFGVGGVGGYAVEALARAGIGELELIDADRIAESNINRQIIATYSNLGKYKVDAFSERVKDINPDCKITARVEFFLEESVEKFDFSSYNYVIDAIDTVAGKIALAAACENAGTPIISAMGAGNKLDPTAFTVSDIYKTSVCPLARAVRAKLKKMGIKKLKVVYSKEDPISCHPSAKELFNEGERAPGSLPFVPSVMGLIIASEVVKDLIKDTH